MTTNTLCKCDVNSMSKEFAVKNLSLSIDSPIDFDTKPKIACCLHIGMPKTATTTLQNTLFPRHSEVIYLGKRSSDPKFADSAIETFYHQLGESPEAISDTLINDCRKRIEQLRQQAGLLVMSKESLTAAPLKKKRQQARRLRELFNEARILITIREPVSFMEAFYFQSLKGHLYNKVSRHLLVKHFGRPPGYFDFDEWLDLSWNLPGRGAFNHLEIADTVEIYAQEFGRENIVILPFEELKRDSTNFYRTLSDRIGINSDESISLGRGETRNVRWNAETIRRLREMCDSRFLRWKHQLLGGKESLKKYLGVHEMASQSNSPKARAEISDVSRERILSVSRPQCERLVREWNVPLAEYGYPVETESIQRRRAA